MKPRGYDSVTPGVAARVALVRINPFLAPAAEARRAPVVGAGCSGPEAVS